MTDHEPRMLAAINLFNKAALGLDSWTNAMDAFAISVNARTGQLIGFGSSECIPFNVMTGMAESAAGEFVAAGGGSRVINSRVRVGLDAPEMALRDDRHFTVEQDCHTTPALYEWHARHRVGYTCLANLMKHDDYTVGVAAINESGHGQLSDKDRKIFRLLSEELRRAIRLQIAIEGQQAQLITGSFEAFDQAIFVCAPGGTVVARSALAEELLAQERWLTLRDGKLCLSDGELQSRFEYIVARPSAANILDKTDTDNIIIVRDPQGYPMPLECAPFPIQGDLTTLALSLVIAHPPRPQEDRMAKLANRLFALTPTESLIAAYLSSGHGPVKISERCGVARGTVRTHLKRIFDKTGARSQVELVALLAAYR